MQTLIEEEIINSNSKTELNNKEFDCCKFVGINFTNLKLKNSIFNECEFLHCNFSNTTMEDISIRDSHFLSCKFMGFDFSSINTFFDNNFEDSQIKLSSFYKMKLNGIIFKNTDIIQTDFNNTELKKSKFENSDLMETTFEMANLDKADFSTAKNYLINPNNTSLKDTVFSLPEAISFLKAIGIKLK